MKCTIAGASGLVGKHLLDLLLEAKDVEAIFSIVRSTSGKRHAKLVENSVDWERLQPEDLGTPDIVFCCLGTTLKKAGSQDHFRHVDHTLVVKLAAAAKKAGARKFAVVSALGANATSPIFYSRVKGEMERDVRLAGPIAISIFRPSLLLGKRTESRPAERLAIALFPFYRHFLIGPLRKQMPIAASQVATAMLKDARAPISSGVNVILNHEMLS